MQLENDLILTTNNKKSMEVSMKKVIECLL